MAHCAIDEADAVLDKEVKVLDKGFLRLVDYMGSDERIVQAARVSYGEGTKTYREDAGLIDYLLRNEHTSPFEQVVFTFHAKMPIFVARQWVRHRTARLNEISGRYSILKNEFYVPDAQDIAAQSTDNKQGRQDEPMPREQAEEIIQKLEKTHAATYKSYEELLEAGTARELARMVLPLSLYTEWYWQIDLHNLFHFLKLRLDSHAQREIRVYAEAMLKLATPVCPRAFKSFEQNVLCGVRYSSMEMEGLNRMLKGKDHGLSGKAAVRFLEKTGGKK